VIHLIRHGETPGNAGRVVQTPETPLSERGLAQAQRLAARLAGARLGGILASDLARAAMTAHCVAETTGLDVAFEPLLHERNFGDLRGTPYSELGVDLFAAELVPPGGESWRGFHQRVDRAWQRILTEAARCDGDLAVVTHGLVCLSITTRLAQLPNGEDPELSGFANTSVTLIEDTPPHRVALLDCTAHLSETRRDGGRV
jgi:probable phosphoglycerate mutase